VPGIKATNNNTIAVSASVYHNVFMLQIYWAVGG
jgi:hypothetical protein